MDFSLLIGLGAALGLGWVALKSPGVRRLPGSIPHGLVLDIRFIDAGLWVLLGSMLGGRAVHVAAAWPYFMDRLLEIPQVWLGGLSGPGSALGALLAVSIYALATGLQMGVLADALLPLATSLAVSGWLACWMAGCAYGAPMPWGIPAVNEWGEIRSRLPVQLLGALLALLLFWLLERAYFSSSFENWALPWNRSSGQGARLRRPFLLARLVLRKLGKPVMRLKNLPAGRTACAMLCLLFLETAGLSFLRADPTPLLLGLRLDALAWTALALLSGLAGWFFSNSARRSPPASPDQIP